jgi:hypothetical protein
VAEVVGASSLRDPSFLKRGYDYHFFHYPTFQGWLAYARMRGIIANSLERQLTELHLQDVEVPRRKISSVFAGLTQGRVRVEGHDYLNRKATDKAIVGDHMFELNIVAFCFSLLQIVGYMSPLTIEFQSFCRSCVNNIQANFALLQPSVNLEKYQSIARFLNKGDVLPDWVKATFREAHVRITAFALELEKKPEWSGTVTVMVDQDTVKEISYGKAFLQVLEVANLAIPFWT